LARAGDPKALEFVASLARQDSPDGYSTFYTLIRGEGPPKHSQAWIKEIFDAKNAGKGLVIEAFRGATKTTVLTVLFVAHRIGLEPHKSNLIVQLNDAAVDRNVTAIISIIEHNPWWKVIFPNVKPDKDHGWSQKGYWVKNTAVPYETWIRMVGIDATLSAWGYSSGAIVGLHPTGVLVIDDIHGDENTSSPRQLEEVMDIIKGTIMPTLVPGAFHVVVGTPWVEGDTIAYFKALPKSFRTIRTPLTDKTWPEKFTPEVIEELKEKSGAVEFARMYQLDLEAAKGHTLKREWLGWYPYEDVKEEWATFMGVDYASTADRLKTRHRDECAMVWGKLTPRGDLVVLDGIAEQMSQADSNQRLIALASSFPTLQQIGIETIGKGEEFYELLQSAPVFLPLMPIPSHTGIARSKGGRFEKVLGPLFQRRRVLLSTRVTPFIKKFIDQWVCWDGTGNTGDDCLDGVYMMVKAAEGFIALPTLQVTPESPLWFERERKPNPWNSLRNANG